jgi:hypothetical protein
MRTSNHLQRKTSFFILSLLASAVSLVWTQRVSGAELIQNGSFAAGMTNWKVAPKLAGWNPTSTGVASLSPTTYGYSGILFYQDLNVTNTSSGTLSLSVGLKKSYASGATSVAIYLDYATVDLQIKRLTAFTPENAALPDAVFTNLSVTVSLPAEATKVVRLLIGVLDPNNSFEINRVSLSAAGLSLGPVPNIQSVFPSTGAYYSTTNSGLITIYGSNLGTNGQVYLGTAPMETVGMNSAPLTAAQIVTWTGTQVVARIVEPMSSGRIYLLSGGVESQGDRSFTITSPLFTCRAVEPEATVLRGQKHTVVFRVDFLNGFQTAGGVSAMLVSPLYSPPDAAPLFASGGFSFEVDTTTLANGDYVGMAQTLEGSSYARWAPFVLKVRSITNISFTTGYPAVAISSVTLTNQGEFSYNFGYRLADNTGADIANDISSSGVTVTSDNPAVAMVFNDKFGPRYFALAEGKANLLFTTPNGYSRTLPITVTLPPAPRFTSASMVPAVADNSGLSTNSVYWQGTENITWVGYEGMTTFPLENIKRDAETHSASWTFGVPEGTAPGNYLFHAQLGETATMSFLTLTVVNAASKGQISGSILTVDSGGFFMHETMGNLELYDANTGNIVRTNFIQNFNSDTYVASYLAPGSYRARWVPLNESTSPQWYPQAASFAQAATIQVLAGQTATNINFYPRPVPAAPAELSLPLPSVNGTELTFGMSTVFGVTYFLEYKDGLEDSTWKTAQQLSGTGSPLVLADPSPSGVHRFYRIRMQTP